MTTNYKQIFSKVGEMKKIVKQHCTSAVERSGIYMFYRFEEESSIKYAYIGQAKRLLTRLAQHLVNKSQHIDKSLYKRGLYSQENPYGWHISVITYCPEEKLDKFEQAYIKKAQESGFSLYNVTGGGQFDKEQDINERYQPNLKRYKSGKNKGYEKCLTEVRTYFNKYLDYSIKPPTNKIKERKAEEFKKFLNKYD